MAAKDEKKEKEKIARETLGKYFYDLSKTSFGTGVVGTVVSYFMKGADFTWGLFALSLVATVAFAYTGNKILRK